MMNKNIWFCGVPGSKWSGVDIQLRRCLPCDQTDETPERLFYHRVNVPGDKNNGHKGAYWGPGMGCGENWNNLNYLTKEQVQHDIDQVFSGEGYRIIKSHFFARHHNLDWLWENMKGDYIILLYKEPQASFAWWCNVMDFSEDHWPDYRPGYKDYNTMRPMIFEETCKIVDFAMRKNMQWGEWNPNKSLDIIPGVNKDEASIIKRWPDEKYMAVAEIT